MSDKKEVTELSIKVSVDTTELDKLEAQLRRINGLIASIGLKKPASGGFVTHYINIDNGQAYFNGASLKAADITHLFKQELEEVARVKKAEDEALIIALKKAVEKSLIYVARSNAKGV